MSLATCFRLCVRTIVPGPPLPRAGGIHQALVWTSILPPSSQAIHRPSPAQPLEASLGPDHLHSLTCFSLEASWDPALLVTSVKACAKEELWSPPSQQARARHKADGLCPGRWDTAVKRVGCPSGASWACSVPRVGGESVTLQVRRIELLASAVFEIPLGFYSFIQHPRVPGPM